MYKKSFALTELPVTKKRAFTLIELLVVLSLIMLTVVFGVPAFNKYGDRAEVNSTAEQIQATIEKAYANSNAPPRGTTEIANEIHLWLMDGTPDLSSGQVVFARGFHRYPKVPGDVSLAQVEDDPGVTSLGGFLADTVTIPSYMHLRNNSGPDHDGHSIRCYFVVAGDITCTDLNAPSGGQIDMGNNFDMILTSDKTTDVKYHISISKNPFRVRTNAE